MQDEKLPCLLIILRQNFHTCPFYSSKHSAFIIITIAIYSPVGVKIERGRAVVHDSDIDKMLGLVDNICDGVNVCGPTCRAERWWGTLQNKQKSKIKHVQNKTKTCNVIIV